MITLEPREEAIDVPEEATVEGPSSGTSIEPIDGGASLGAKIAATARDAAAAVAWAFVGFAILGVLWQLVASRVPDLPGPVATFQELGELLTNTPFAAKGADGSPGIGYLLFGSLQRVFIGFGFAVLAGVPFGFLIGGSKRAWRAANPLIQLLRPVSPLAWFPLWLVILKNAPQAAVWVIFVTSLWPIIINTAAGASSVPSDQRNVARVFRFGRLPYLRHVVVPHTLPAVITGLRLSMGVAWMVIVAVEMLSGGTGIGFFVWDSYNALNLARIVAAIILIGLIGVVLDQIFLFLGRKATPPEVAS